MTGSDRPGDPTMDEILASIRKIIADEPIGSRPLPEPRLKTVAALAETDGGAGLAADRSSPGFGRLADAIRNGSAPTPRSPVRPAKSIDDDLADILDGSPLAARERPAERPRLGDILSRPDGTPPRTGGLGADRLTAKDMDSLKAPSDHRGTPLPPAGRSLDWPPLGGRETAPSPLGLSALMSGRPEPTLSPAAGAPESAGPFVADGGKPLDIGTIVPGLMNLANPPPAASALAGSPPRASTLPDPVTAGDSFKPAFDAKVPLSENAPLEAKSPILAAAEAAQAMAAKFEPKSEPRSEPKPERKAETRVEPKKSEPEVIAAMPMPTAVAAPAARTPPGAPLAKSDNRFAPAARPAPEGLPSQPDLTSPLQPAPRRAAAPESDIRTPRPADPAPANKLNLDTSAAAASALGALAAGLAATRAKAGDGAPPPPADPVKAEPVKIDARAEAVPSEDLPKSVCSVPDFFIHGVARRNPAPVRAPAERPPAGDIGAAASGLVLRSLEDTVAELLRPMLRQWLADNMPRIVEKALRVEVAESLLPGSKRPGN